jgi:hypothetical protein
MHDRVLDPLPFRTRREFNPAREVRPVLYPVPGSTLVEKSVAFLQLAFAGFGDPSSVQDLDLQVDMTPLAERLKNQEENIRGL